MILDRRPFASPTDFDTVQRMRAHLDLLLVADAAIDDVAELAAERGVRLSCAVDARAQLEGADKAAFRVHLVDLLESAIALATNGSRAGLEIVVGTDGEMTIDAWYDRCAANAA